MKWFFVFFLFLFEMSFCDQGIVYRKVETPLSQIVHVLDVDMQEYHLKLKRALDDGLGRESVVSIAKRYKSVAAVNGGFFEIGGMYDGLPKGVLRIEKKWYALPLKNRGVLGWDLEGKNFVFDRLKVFCFFEYKGKKYPISGINCLRKENQMIGYCFPFHRTTLTSMKGVELVIQDQKIKKISQGGSLAIPQEGWVVSIDQQHPLFQNLWQEDEICDVVFELFPFYHTKGWEELDYIVGGTPLLIKNGKVIEDFSIEKTKTSFLERRHARTAVGRLSNHHVVFVVVDHIPGKTQGMTMKELASFMKNLGCLDALNLDGGGSSTLVFHEQVVNAPFGDADEDIGKGRVRRVSDAIVISKR